MVLGIISLFAWCVPPLAVVLCILAIIFGFVGMKQHKGMAITGIVCGGPHALFWISVFLVGAGILVKATH